MASSRAHKMQKGQYASGGAVGRAMRTMRRHYADGGDVVKERAMFLPLGTYGDGTTRAAWPGLLYEPAAAWKRMMDSGYRPGDAETTRQMAEDSFTVAGAAPIAGLAAGAVRGRMPRATLSSNAAHDAAKRLPMDEASRMARAREMGYADDAFYRGEASGKAPTEYGFGHFSRDQEYAEGFAKRGGADAPREFRLNLGNAFVDYQPVTSSQYAKILDAVAADNPKLANNMLGQLTDKGMDWFKGYVERYPDRPVVESGALVRAGLGSHDDALRYIKAAGFGSIDSGRDVVKLTGDGIRLKDAKFDPKKAASKNILAANRGAVPVVPSDPTED